MSRNVIVVGAGNAGLCAALAARQRGAAVTVLECAPEDERGGNSRFTAGAIRFAYRGVDDLRALMPDLSDSEIESTDFGAYPEDQFFDDMARLTDHRANPDLVELLVTRSRETLLWMRGHGVRFLPMYGRQAFKVDGRFRFWGGLTVEAAGGGPGLVDSLHKAAGEAVICQGEQGDSLFLIARGVIRVSRSGEGGSHDMASLIAGDFFGEIALLKETLRTADVTALSYCQVLALFARDFNQLLDANPELRARIEKIAEERLAGDH